MLSFLALVLYLTWSIQAFVQQLDEASSTVAAGGRNEDQQQVHSSRIQNASFEFFMGWFVYCRQHFQKALSCGILQLAKYCVLPYGKRDTEH